MIALGIDFGLRVSAFARVERSRGRFRLLDVDEFRNPATVRQNDCIELAANALRQRIALRDYDRLVLEAFGYVRGRTGPGSLNCARLNDRVEQYAAGLGCDMLVIRKIDANRQLGLRGKVPKSRVKRHMTALFGRDVGKNEHQRDAVLLAVVGVVRR